MAVGEDNASLGGLVAFRLGGRSLAFPVGDVREVVPMAWLTKPPSLPSMIEGILNLAGTAVPVLRIDRLLGVEGAEYGLGASILIMKGGRAPLGVLVEHLEGVWNAERFGLMPVDPASSLNGCLAGVLESGADAVGLLSWRKLLLAEERDRLEEFQLRTQARLEALEDASP